MAVILADDIVNCIFLNENDRIPIHISLKYVPRSPIDNKPAFVQEMAWRRIGDKPLPGLTIFLDNNILVGLWLNCIWSVEITLFLLADILF